MKDELINYYDYIRRLAQSKCSTIQDAEDLVSETFLAAYSFLHRGGNIEYPKTWLTNTFMHKYNSSMRKLYSNPIIVDYDSCENLRYEEGDDDFSKADEAAKLRRELLYLSKTARDVLVRFYYNGYSIAEISRQLHIPEGTVKSRLSAGRENIKKGLTGMIEKKNNIPATLSITWSGSDGPNNEPITLVEGDLIVQNLLILAYERPLTITGLADAIGIPTVYIEPIVERLVEGELMVKTEGGKYYTDFIIFNPDDFLSRFESQIAFVKNNFDSIWTIVSKMIDEINSTEYAISLNIRKKRKLERYCILKVLQKFQISQTQDIVGNFPKRKDGGSWIAAGYKFPSGYDVNAYREADEYAIQGGHRTSGGKCDYNGAKFLKLCEFDTTLWDNPHRFAICGFKTYFKDIGALLWSVYKEIDLDSSGISDVMIESIDNLIANSGLIARDDGKLTVDIPILARDEYKVLNRIIDKYHGSLIAELSAAFKEYLKNSMVEIPRHLSGIRDWQRYMPSTHYFVMGVVREAYSRGLHLSDVDYCCPPAILIYEE